jgi:hypothetical protein
MPPHTAPLAREPRWLGWYAVSLCVPACAVTAFGIAALSCGVSDSGALVAAVMCALMVGFFGGMLLIHARSRRAWLVAVLGGLGVASIASGTVGAAGPARVGRSLCEHGSGTDCSKLGRTASTWEERAQYNEKACAHGIRGACGRLARDNDAALAQRTFDGYCATRSHDYRCSQRDVTTFCGSASSMDYYSANMCNGDY